MKSLVRIMIAAAAIVGLASCSNTTGQIGSDLVTDETEVVIENSFAVTGHSTASNVPVQSRTTTEILGIIDAKGYGRFTSEFVTQFIPASKLDTEGVTVNDIDSIRLIMDLPATDGWVGDSIVPMGLKVYRLNRQLPSPIYSDFDPKGYYDESTGLIGSEVYAVNVLEKPDSVQNLSYRTISVKLPLSLGRELYQLYLDNPAAYSTPMEFAKYFPGIAVVNSFGSGRLVKIGMTTICLYYHTTETDDDGTQTTVSHEGPWYAVAPEIVTNNCFTYEMAPELQARIEAGDNIICAPAGRDVELTFPAREVRDYYYRNSGSLSVINTLTFTIPAESVTNTYGITPPPTLLLVLSKDRDKFFADNKTPDNVTSFYASYNTTSHQYSFSGLRPYLLDLLDRYGREGDIPAEDYTFTAVPVTVTTETAGSSYYSSGTTYVSSVTPYVLSPVMANLRLDEAEVTLTFSKQTVR